MRLDAFSQSLPQVSAALAAQPKDRGIPHLGSYEISLGRDLALPDALPRFAVAVPRGPVQGLHFGEAVSTSRSMKHQWNPQAS